MVRMSTYTVEQGGHWETKGMSKVDAARTGSKEAGGCEHWRLWPRAVRFHCLFLSAQQGLLQRVAEPPMASRGSTGFEGSDEAP